MLVFALTTGYLWLFYRIDREFAWRARVFCRVVLKYIARRFGHNPGRSLWIVPLLLCMLQELCIYIQIMNLFPGKPERIGEKMEVYTLLCIFAASLLAACISDILIKQVYRFVWWIAGMVGVILLLAENPAAFCRLEELLPLAVFCLLQYWLFAGWYGRADCHAFCVCALMQRAWGIPFSGYLLQMLLAFEILAFVQGIRHNINRAGNLKKPVAFLPYIAFSLIVIILLYNLAYLCKK